jgi:hypothetical protein
MKVIKVALASLATLLAAWILISWLSSKEKDRKLLSWIKVAVTQIDQSIPPGLLVEVSNNGPRIVGRTHFRLVFKSGGTELCRVDSDYGDFKPNENRRLVLKCAGGFWKTRHLSGKIHYVLRVFPELKKSLPMIEGEFLTD